MEHFNQFSEVEENRGDHKGNVKKTKNVNKYYGSVVTQNRSEENVSNGDSVSFPMEVHFVRMMFLPTINMWHLGFKTIEHSN